MKKFIKGLLPLLPVKLKYSLYMQKARKRDSLHYSELEKNKKFKDLHQGKRCFIIGNGPSINKIDLARLKNEVTFTVNQLSRKSEFASLNSSYHMWADERFFQIDESKPEDMELLETMKKVRVGEKKPTVFYKISAYDMIKKYNLDDDLDVYYFSEMGFRNIDCGINFDFCKSVPSFSTVVQYLIVLAVYMGFKDIYLLGCDCTGIINTVQSRMQSACEMEYAYNISEHERKRMEKSNSMYPIQDELRWYATIFDDYELLRKYCKSKNVNLFNATDGSLISCLPKVKLSDIL